MIYESLKESKSSLESAYYCVNVSALVSFTFFFSQISLSVSDLYFGSPQDFFSLYLSISLSLEGKKELKVPNYTLSLSLSLSSQIFNKPPQKARKQDKPFVFSFVFFAFPLVGSGFLWLLLVVFPETHTIIAFLGLFSHQKNKTLSRVKKNSFCFVNLSLIFLAGFFLAFCLQRNKDFVFVLGLVGLHCFCHCAVGGSYNSLLVTVDELMSLAVGAVSSSKNMGFDENKEEGEKSTREIEEAKQEGDDEGGKISRQMSEASLYTTDQEEEDDGRSKLELGPQYTLKEQLEKDKDDESLRRWKEQLLGSVDLNNVGETLEPDVKIFCLSIISPGRSDIVLPIPEDGKPKGIWFTLKEGSKYKLKFSFQVSNNIVSGLKYTNTVWKTGIKVDSSKEMIGTFSPQIEPYTHIMQEETTPSGMFSRGSYSARSKFLDDDNKCYLEINYGFDIRKEWAST